MKKKVLLDIQIRSSKEKFMINEELQAVKKRNKKHLAVKSSLGKPATDFIHKRSEITPGSDQSYKFFKRKTWFDKQKNLFQMVAIGVVMIFVINIFAVFLNTTYLKRDLSYSASQAYDTLIEGGERIAQTNFDSALLTFQTAKSQFDEINQELWFLRDDPVLKGLGENPLQDGERLLAVGQNLSESGQNFSFALQDMQRAVNLFFQETQKSEEDFVPDFERIDKKESVTDQLRSSFNNFNGARKNVEEAKSILEQVNISNFPKEYQEKMKLALVQINSLIRYMEAIDTAFPAILKLLGDEHPHTYLVLFHNSNELRPVLGFIGSYAVIDVDEGYVEEMKIKDVYELDGQFYDEVEYIPEEIKKVGGTLKMRDSNYSPSVEVSLANAAWFYQKQGGKSVDTVISIDQNMLGKILEITGPIEIDGLQAPITAENYDFIVSYIVEAKTFGAENPKIILGQIFNKILEKIKQPEYQPQMAKLAVELIRDKQFLAYSKEEDVQKFFKILGLTGELSEPKDRSDLLQVVRTSIGGNKSDKYVKNNYTHTSYIAQNGNVTDQLKIELQHTWHEGIIRDWQGTLVEFGYSDFSDTLKDILGRGVNKSGVRVYVPNGSELLDVIGMSKDSVSKLYDRDLDKEYFYFEMEVAPQQSTEISIEYRLPFDLNVADVDTYRFSYEPQIGAKNVSLRKMVRGDVGLNNYKNYPDGDLSSAKILEYQVDGTSKQYFSGVWGR